MIIMQTNKGAIKIELDHEKAPQTAQNFQRYVEDGFFDGTIFHRVIDNFMIQGGGFTAEMDQKDTREPIENEADNGLKNKRGSIAMARTSDPHSASSQFFINVKDNDFLNFTSKSSQGWGYCVFAHVIEGMDIVDEIRNVETGSYAGHQDVPVDPIIIEKVWLEEVTTTEE